MTPSSATATCRAWRWRSRARLRSTSLAGIAGGVAAVGLLEWRLLVDQVWSWDLLSVAITIAVVKIATLIFYRLTD